MFTFARREVQELNENQWCFIVLLQCILSGKMKREIEILLFNIQKKLFFAVRRKYGRYQENLNWWWNQTYEPSNRELWKRKTLLIFYYFLALIFTLFHFFQTIKMISSFFFFYLQFQFHDKSKKWIHFILLDLVHRNRNKVFPVCMIFAFFVHCHSRLFFLKGHLCFHTNALPYSV